MSRSVIYQLALLISSSVEKLEKVCHDSQLPLPQLDDPGFSPSTEAFRSNAVAAEAAKIAAAACMQLIASLVPPTDTVYKLAAGGHHAAAVRVCLEANVTEILREAGPNVGTALDFLSARRNDYSKGLHVDKIAIKCGLDSSKLGRIMRYLANHHMYRELKPNVFTNNRVSGILDTGKPFKDIFNDPQHKYDSTGFPALVSHHLDINHKCSTVAWDVLKDPIHGHANDLTDTVLSRAMNTNLTFYQFLEHPDNHFRHSRFGFAMQGIASIQPPDTIFKAYNWGALATDSLVVDVGGGIGVATMPLAKKYPDLRIVIQDLPKAVEEGKRFWADKFPDAINSDRVKFEDHNFFSPQPITNASVFLVKQVLHNYPKQYMSKILRHLREAAMKDTTLIIMDHVLPYACRSPTEAEFVDNEIMEAPDPLLPNYGAIGDNVYTLDITMMFHANAQEHTALGIKDLLQSTGWRLLRIRAVDSKNFYLKSVEAVPI